MKRSKPRDNLSRDWDPEHWRTKCAWCEQAIPEEAEVFGISVALRPEALKEVTLGKIEPLYLHATGKVVPMMVVTADSPAKKAGKDAMFQICSEGCGRALQAALKIELDPRP